MNAPGAVSPGSMWWRSVSERLLRDTTESGLLADGHPGKPTGRSVEIWLEFLQRPSAARWYRAHNASVVAGFLEYEALAAKELLAERFFMNVARCACCTRTRSARSRDWRWGGGPDRLRWATARGRTFGRRRLPHDATRSTGSTCGG